jgi:formamidopyrimidine-DNA glycosylase
LCSISRLAGVGNIYASGALAALHPAAKAAGSTRARAETAVHEVLRSRSTAGRLRDFLAATEPGDQRLPLVYGRTGAVRRCGGRSNARVHGRDVFLATSGDNGQRQP